MPPPTYTQQEMKTIAARFPGRVMLIITKDKKFQYLWHQRGSNDTVKIAVDEASTIQNLNMEIYKLLKNMNGRPITDAIYLSCNGSIVGSNNTVRSLNDRHGKGRFLYLTIHGESTFG